MSHPALAQNDDSACFEEGWRGLVRTLREPAGVVTVPAVAFAEGANGRTISRGYKGYRYNRCLGTIWVEVLQAEILEFGFHP